MAAAAGSQLLAIALVSLLGCIRKMAVPIKYVLFLPGVPRREDLLEADGEGVRRPKYVDNTTEEARPVWSWWDVCELGIIGLCILR